MMKSAGGTPPRQPPGRQRYLGRQRYDGAQVSNDGKENSRFLRRDPRGVLAWIIDAGGVFGVFFALFNRDAAGESGGGEPDAG
jgi:hypothetical protein